MAGFLIYSAEGESPSIVQSAIKLDDGVQWQSVPISGKGPSGALGGSLHYLTTHQRDTWPQLEFDADRQTWHQLPNSNEWVGWWNDNKPTAEALRRESTVDGYIVQLNDGGNWVIPSGMNMPCNLSIDNAGNVVKVTKPEFKSFYDEAVTMLDYAKSLIRKDDPIDDDNLLGVGKYVSSMLQLNYYITFEIAFLLQLFDPDVLWRALSAATDVRAINDLFDELEKGGSTDSGSLPAT